MKEILVNVVVEKTYIRQDRHNSSPKWFVDRVFSITRSGGDRYNAFSNDSVFDTEYEAQERKAQIIKEELF